MLPQPIFIVAVNLYLIYVLFKKPRANPRTLYCEEQNTKLMFELDDGPLTKDAFEETYKPRPMPMPLYGNNIDESLLKDYHAKEHIPKIEAVPDIFQDIVQDTLQEVVPEAVPEAVQEVVPSIYAKYFTNFDRIAFSQTNIKNYTVVVQYENKTASISNSDYVGVVPFYMNVVALMNPK